MVRAQRRAAASSTEKGLEPARCSRACREHRRLHPSRQRALRERLWADSDMLSADSRTRTGRRGVEEATPGGARCDSPLYLYLQSFCTPSPSQGGRAVAPAFESARRPPCRVRAKVDGHAWRVPESTGRERERAGQLWQWIPGLPSECRVAGALPTSAPRDPLHHPPPPPRSGGQGGWWWWWWWRDGGVTWCGDRLSGLVVVAAAWWITGRQAGRRQAGSR